MLAISNHRILEVIDTKIQLFIVIFHLYNSFEGLKYYHIEHSKFFFISLMYDSILLSIWSILEPFFVLDFTSLELILYNN